MGKTDDKVKNILANMKVSKNSKPNIVDIPTVDSNENVPVKKSISDVPRGRPKSGRIWKNTKQRLIFNESANYSYYHFLNCNKNMSEVCKILG